MRTEFHHWLTNQYPDKKSLPLWESHAIGYLIGHFNSTTTPLRTLAPHIYRHESSVFDLAGNILGIISQLPNSAALINTTWHSLMFGDCGQFWEQNRRPTDVDICITSSIPKSEITQTTTQITNKLITRNFISAQEINTQQRSTPWPEIGTICQTRTNQYRSTTMPVMLEIQSLSSHDLSFQDLFLLYQKCYAPFFIRSQGLNLVAVSANQIQPDSKPWYYYSEYPHEFQVTEDILKIKPQEPGNHTISLTAHTEPASRLSTIGPRIALAAALLAIGKSHLPEIDPESTKIVNASLKLPDTPLTYVLAKIHSVFHKASQVEGRLIAANNLLQWCREPKPKIPSLPFSDSSTPIQSAVKYYLEKLGFPTK